METSWNLQGKAVEAIEGIPNRHWSRGPIDAPVNRYKEVPGLLQEPAHYDGLDIFLQSEYTSLGSSTSPTYSVIVENSDTFIPPTRDSVPSFSWGISCCVMRPSLFRTHFTPCSGRGRTNPHSVWACRYETSKWSNPSRKCYIAVDLGWTKMLRIWWWFELQPRDLLAQNVLRLVLGCLPQHPWGLFLMTSAPRRIPNKV